MAYSDSLEYLPSDILTISDEVTEGLIASGSAHEKATILAGRQAEQWQDIAQQTGKARQVAFSRALRVELERINAALPAALPTSAPARRPRPNSPGETAQTVESEAPVVPAAQPQAQQAQQVQQLQQATVAATPKSASCYIQPLRPAEAVQPMEPVEPGLDEVSLRHVDVQKDEGKFASNPWMGVSRLNIFQLFFKGLLGFGFWGTNQKLLHLRRAWSCNLANDWRSIVR